MPSLVRLLHSIYKTCISPLLGDVCRFEPCCSDYALQAVERFGWLPGLLLAAKRLLRCHPYCKGGYDPVPGANHYGSGPFV